VNASATRPQSGRKSTVDNTGLSTRESILAISTELFAKEGYDRVTMRDISSACEVTMPTIYHHFKDKENLYREVEKFSYGAMKDRLLNSIKGSGNPEKRLRAFAAELYDVLQQDPIFLSLAIRNMLDPDENHHSFLVGVALQHVYNAFADLLNEFREGAGSGLGPMIILSSILGFVAMAPAKRLLDGYMYKDEVNTLRERDTFVDYAVSAVMAI
jgi:TetR/AcrR family transcriptional regulator